MVFGLEKVKRDNVHETFGVVITIKFFEDVWSAFFCVGHATTIGEGTKGITGVDVGDKITLVETVESGSRVNDDTPWGKNAPSLGLVQLNGWAYKLEQLYSRYDKRASCCIVPFLLAFCAFNLGADVVWRFPGWCQSGTSGIKTCEGREIIVCGYRY
jgi:hypothetical protein